MITIILALIYQISSLGCLSQSGSSVLWWVVIKTPPKTGVNAYGYYDSTMSTSELKYYNTMLDIDVSPLTHTINVFNAQSYSRVAWNDQKPSGQVSSSVAHSKGVIGFDLNRQQGFFLSHSIPKYPAFDGGQMRAEIGGSQQVYGQHLSCFSMTLGELETLAGNLLIIKPYIYESSVENTSKTQNLYALSQGKVLSQEDQFMTENIKSVYGYNLMAIFKNYKVNGSIFQDGLTNMLGVTPLIAETWGRPLAASWCSQRYQVTNAIKIGFQGVEWYEGDDHSKWLLAGNDYVCLGDMNRMNSQWKRGGAYYCLSDKTLVSAMKKILIEHDSCPSKIKNLSTE